MAEKENGAQLVVIGAGPGGYPAAFLAADMGMQVTLIDPEPNPGGVCLYRGCIPTKTLLHIAKVIREADEARKWGVEFTHPKIHLDHIRAFKNSVVQKMTGGIGQLCKLRKITAIQGTARFLDPHTLSVQKKDGTFEKLRFDHAILATGSHSASLPNTSIASPHIMDSTQAMELESVPETMLVVGGGYIGLELGTVYATLGTRVSVVEMMPSLLPGADEDLVRVYSQSTKNFFHEIMLRTMVSRMEETQNGIKVRFEGEGATVKEKMFNKVLITVGRKPNSSDLGLEQTKIECDRSGFVRINKQCQTAEPSIYAIGDVVGGALLAHKATHEGKVAVEVIAGKNATFEPRAIPAVLFTDPEIAWCGLTETEAKNAGREVTVAKFPWGASGRASTLGRMDGLTKLLVDAKTEKILGVGLVGPGAGELISEGALAVEMEASVSDVAKTIHPHPTLSETLMEAAEVFYGHCTHIYRPKK